MDPVLLSTGSIAIAAIIFMIQMMNLVIGGPDGRHADNRSDAIPVAKLLNKDGAD